VDREKVLKGLEICNDMGNSDYEKYPCEKCPYTGNDICGYMLDRDARDTILADAAEIAELEDVVYNLRLYLTRVKDTYPDLFMFLMERFDGMPGFVPEEE